MKYTTANRNDLLLVVLGLIACLGLWMALGGLPGSSALFPRILLGTMILCLLFVGAQALRKGGTPEATNTTPASRSESDWAADLAAGDEGGPTESAPNSPAQNKRIVQRQLGISAALIAFVAWFAFIGPFSAVALFTTGLAWLLHPERNKAGAFLVSAVIGLCLAAFVYVVFGYALQVSFPRGLETLLLQRMGL